MKKITTLSLLVLAILMVGIFFWPDRSAAPIVATYKQDDLAKKTVTTSAGDNITVLIAESEESRVLGLSGYPKLNAGQGMLFIFPEENLHGIWMKEMLFSLDILWLDQRGEILHVVSGATPESYPDEIFFPERPARYVLELASGEVGRLNLKKGDVINL